VKGKSCVSKSFFSKGCTLIIESFPSKGHDCHTAHIYVERHRGKRLTKAMPMKNSPHHDDFTADTKYAAVVPNALVNYGHPNVAKYIIGRVALQNRRQ
jgi:hypothetical protein